MIVTLNFNSPIQVSAFKENVISNGPIFKEGHSRFTTVPFKP